MNYTERIHLILDGMSPEERAETPASHLAEKVGCAKSTARDAARKWRERKSPPKKPEEPTEPPEPGLETVESSAPPEDTSERAYLDWGEREYLFKIDGWGSFDIPFNQIQSLVEWYVHAGAGMTQKECARQLYEIYERKMQAALLRKVLRALGVDKNSLPFAPHRYREEDVEDLADRWRAKDEALVEAKYRAGRTRYLEKRLKELSGELSTLKDFIADSVERAELEPPSINTHKSDERYVKGEDVELLLLSDWHVGSDSSTTIDRQVDSIIKWYERRPELPETLYVGILGDMIDGPMGDMHPQQWMRQSKHGIEQCTTASRLIAYLLTQLDHLLGPRKLKIRAVPGNHGRTRKNREQDPQRIAETLVYHLAKAQFAGESSRFAVSHTPVYLERIGGTCIIYGHGDKGPKDKRDWAYSLASPGERVLIVTGHLHQPQSVGLADQNVLWVQNGALQKNTEFDEVNLGMTHRPSQRVIYIDKEKGPILGPEIVP